MKGITLSEAIRLLEEREQRYYDLTLPAAEVRMNPDGTIKLNGFTQAKKLQDQALTTLANRIGIQAGYLRKCAGDLLDLRAHNINRWLEKLPVDTEFLVRMDGSECRAILSTSYVPVGNLQLLSLFAEIGGTDDLMINLEVDAIGMAAQIYWTSGEHTVQLSKPGDITHLGIHIGNSEVGFHSVELAAYLFRLVCKNGLIVGEKQIAFRRTHLASPDSLMFFLTEALPRIRQTLPQLGRSFRLAAAIVLDYPTEELEKIADRCNLSQQQRKLVAEQYEQESDPTLFGLINAFTGAANQDGIGFESRRALQRAGGAVLSHRALVAQDQAA